MGATALRTSLIWHDEVMVDLVHDRPVPVTVGASSDATMLTPDLRLPDGFAIVQPGRRGYVLTLGERMAGTIRVDGVEHDVAAFVRAGDDATGFRATALADGDWGLVELDETGDCKLFFQFVPVEAPIRSRGLLHGLFGGDGESRASLAFSVTLHLAILALTFQLYESSEPFVWPGPRSMTGHYIVTRLDDPPPEVAVAKPAVATIPTVPSTPLPPARTMPETVWRPVKPTRTIAEPTTRPPTKGQGVLQYADVLAGVTGTQQGDAIDRFQRLSGDGPRAPGGTEVGGGPKTRGDGPPGGVGPIGTHQAAKRPLDTGGLRAGVCVGSGCGGGGGPVTVTPPVDPPDRGPELTKEDIERVMRSKQGLFGACYQRVLDRAGPTAGDLQVRFTIDAQGKVTRSKITGGSLTNDTVRSCVTRTLTLLRFPAKGGAIVNYPFMFSMGG